jgi:hypothetical protein
MATHRRRRNPGPGLSTGAIVGIVAGGGLLAYFIYNKFKGPAEPSKELGADKAEEPAAEQPAAEEPAVAEPAAAEQPAAAEPAAAEQPAAKPTASAPRRVGTLTNTKNKALLKITSNVEGASLLINDKSLFDTSIPIIPRTFDFPVDGTLDGPVRVKIQLRWPNKTTSLPMTLTLKAGDVTTIRLNPVGYVQKSYYAGIAEKSKDTATGARNRLMGEALDAQIKKKPILAVQKYEAVISGYPGSSEAKAASVAVAIIKRSAAYKAAIKG